MPRSSKIDYYFREVKRTMDRDRPRQPQEPEKPTPQPPSQPTPKPQPQDDPTNPGTPVGPGRGGGG